MTLPDISAIGADYVSIAKTDERKRLPIGRYATREPISGWKVWRSPDGTQILLEAIVEAADA